MTGSNHALVMGASGLIGWGVVNELLSADGIAPSAFKRVTALVNRSIDKQQMYWPVVHPTQPHFLLVDGVNLMEGEQKTTELLREKVPDAETITHAFYFGMSAYPHEEECIDGTEPNTYTPHKCFAPTTSPSEKLPPISPC